MKISSDYPPPRKLQPSVRAGEQADSRGFTLDLDEILRILRRRFWLIVGCVAAALLIGGYWLSTVTPKYFATAQVMLGQTSASPTLEDLVSGVALDNSAIEGEIALLQSSRLLVQVAQDLGLEEDVEFNPRLGEGPSWFSTLVADAKQAVKGLMVNTEPPAADERFGAAAESQQEDSDTAALEEYAPVIGALRGSLDVRRRGASTVIEITASSESPVKAAAIVNTLADVYIADQLETKFGSARRVTDWLSTRLTSLKEQLENSEAELREFRSDLSAGTTESALAQEDRIAELSAAAEEARALAAEQEARLDRLRTVLERRGAVAAANLIETEAVRTARAELAELEGAEDPELRERAAAARATLEAEVAREIEELETSLAATQDRLETVVPEIAATREEQREVRARDLARLQQMEREAEANRMIYETFLARFLEAGEIEGLQQADAKVVSYAAPPGAPATPRVTASLALSIAAGGFLGLGLAFLVEHRNRAVMTADQVREQLGIPVVGEFSRVNLSHGGMLELAERGAVSPIADEARSLRNYLALSVEPPIRVAAVTSSSANEGKTSVCLLLAWATARMGRSCIVVDADLRRPSVTRALGAEEGPDLIDVLAGTATLQDAVRFDETHGIHLLPCLRAQTDSSRLLASDRAKEMFEALRARFDLVLIDLMPMFMVNDATLLAREADAVLFAIEWNKTPLDAVRRCLRALEDVHADTLGAILTQIDRRREALYQYRRYDRLYREYSRDYQS